MTREARAASPTGRFAFAAAVAAAGLFAMCIWGFGAALPGYSQAAHPVALLGARGIAHAQAFDVCAFVLPGLAAAWVCWRLRSAMPARADVFARLGAGSVLLAALAFALQGGLPFDPQDPDSSASRAHAAAWAAWWVAFVAGAGLLAVGRDRESGSRAWRAGCACAAIAVALFAATPWTPLPAAVAQRVAFAVWFVWLVAAARRG